MKWNLQQTPGIYLVGFMGSGKTTVGRLLARRLGWRFLDLDDAIEAAQGATISAIFDTRGEAEFRRIETEAIRAAVGEVPAVVALGGGAFAQPANRALLEGHGVSVWLDCPLELARARVLRATHRPLARDPVRFEQLYDARRESYALADARVVIESDDPAAAVEAILALFILP
jgi:shikimate kinase